MLKNTIASICGRLLLGAIACLAAAAGAGAAAGQETAAVVEHRLAVTLDPVHHRLSVEDRIAVSQPESPLTFRLADRISVRRVTIDGKGASYTHKNGRLRIVLKRQRDNIDIVVAYSGQFNDDAPIEPLNTDNPGFGVVGTIQSQGTMLLAGAQWYPDAEGLADRYECMVDAPEGIVAVTAGTPAAIVTERGRTRSSWSGGADRHGLPLVAGAYIVNRREFGRTVAATYFSSALQHLSDNYLAATGRYLKFYETLFGPYPFGQFAVVQNFFPTGYGFPSFTLMGGRVLQLPFIIHTSLGHEIAHCWWGNGVLVDPSQGNWSEGLTSYVADYLYSERSGQGRQHRGQWLQNYASLGEPARDLPLSRFMHRIDPVTRVVGYDKGAMVFHMLRRTVGDENFWSTLRAVYTRHRFTAITWSDLQHAFEQSSGRSLAPFFNQWVFRSGAPRLKLADVTVAPSPGGYAVSGKILQVRPYFSLEMEVRLETADETHLETITVEGGQTDFLLFTRYRPLSLTADPDVHLFRRLAPEEVPPSINRLKSAEAVIVVVARHLGVRGMQLARRLAAALGLKGTAIDFEDRIPAADLADSNLLFVGQPVNRTLIAADTNRLAVRTGGFDLMGQRHPMPGSSFFGVFAHALHPGRLAALFLPGASADDSEVSIKIPHYGKYSYLAFDGAQNRAKGQWPAGESPLAVRWPGSAPSSN